MRISDWSSDVCSSDLALNEARGSISQQLVATIGLLEASLPASPKVGLELGEDRDIRSGKAVNRLPIVSDGKDLGEWFLMLERLDQVGPRIRDILEFIDENERIGALIAACLDEAHRVAAHGIEIEPFGLVGFP